MNKNIFFDKIIIRTPLKPMCCCEEFLSKPIESILNDTCIEQAIFIASPSLYKELCNYSALSEREKIKSRNALIRYLLRLSSRCTPFGLFAGVSVVLLGNDETNVCVKELHVTPYLDTSVLLKIAEHFIQFQMFNKKALLYLNSTLYPILDEYKYIDNIFDGETIQYNISSIKRTDLIDKICSHCVKGCTLDSLVLLIHNLGYSMADAGLFVKDLIENHILISELSVNLIGTPYLERLVKFIQCNNFNPMSQIVDLYNQMKELSSNSHFNKMQIVNIQNSLDSLFNDSCDGNNRKICIDVYNSVSASSRIGKRVLIELKNTISFLSRFVTIDVNVNLQKFKDVFEEVYGSNEVQLCKVLDPEIGIGYPVLSTDMINDLNFQADFYLPQNERNLFLTRFEKMILEKISDSHAIEDIQLRDEDLQFLPTNDRLYYPSTFFVLFEIIADNINKTSIRIISIGDYNSCNLIARFANNNDEIEQVCRDLYIFDQNLRGEDSSRVYAQIVHLPNLRAGNVIRHPHFLDYEIPIGTYSSLDIEKVINYRDLLISVQNNRIVLRSSVLDKEVVPILNNAYNYSTSSVPLYRFLCDLQEQNCLSFPDFTVANLKTILRYIPRVTYRNTILVPSTWRIQSKKFDLGDKTLDDKRLLKVFLSVFQQYGIPYIVFIEEGDNKLYLNINSSTSIKAALPIIRRNQDVIFSEVLYDEDLAVIKDNKGSGYVNECVAFMSNVFLESN